jgi:hypothetical protein
VHRNLDFRRAGRIVLPLLVALPSGSGPSWLLLAVAVLLPLYLHLPSGADIVLHAQGDTTRNRGGKKLKPDKKTKQTPEKEPEEVKEDNSADQTDGKHGEDEEGTQAGQSSIRRGPGDLHENRLNLGLRVRPRPHHYRHLSAFRQSVLCRFPSKMARHTRFGV